MGTKIAEAELELQSLREQGTQLDERLSAAEKEHDRAWKVLVGLVGERAALDARVEIVRSQLAKAGRPEMPSPEAIAKIERAILGKLPQVGPEHPRDAEWIAASRVVQLVARELGVSCEVIQRIAGDLGRSDTLHERCVPSMAGVAVQWASGEVVRVRRAAKLAPKRNEKPSETPARVHGPSSYGGVG